LLSQLDRCGETMIAPQSRHDFVFSIEVPGGEYSRKLNVTAT
jgi:hypothetical protein